MINLFEYQNKVKFPGSSQDLESFLDDIWSKREKSSFYQDVENERIETQQFLQFLHKSEELKSNKYAGVIQFQGHTINLLPKIFFDSDRTYSAKDINCIHKHILWWLSYCRKIKFPSYQTSLGGLKSDFFEVLIYLFSKYTHNLLFSSIYQQYEEEEKEVSYIKGRLNVNGYINENLSKGRWQKLNCTYDIFTLDNKFNRIIKYVANLLFHVTTNFENKKLLREILLILDEVTDCRTTVEECANIQFNPLFSEFNIVRDYCLLFLNNSISFTYKNDLKLFAFLLPMEYVFEDFIFGFMDKEIEDVHVKAQVTSTHLDSEKNFALRPDMLLKIDSREIIADTKYKIVYADEQDPKKGITQSDLYQVLAYGVRFAIKDIILFYPNTIRQDKNELSEINIKDELAGGVNINIKAYQLPIINHELFSSNGQEESDLHATFEQTKNLLSKRIKEVLLPIAE